GRRVIGQKKDLAATISRQPHQKKREMRLSFALKPHRTKRLAENDDRASRRSKKVGTPGSGPPQKRDLKEGHMRNIWTEKALPPVWSGAIKGALSHTLPHTTTHIGDTRCREKSRGSRNDRGSDKDCHSLLMATRE